MKPLKLKNLFILAFIVLFIQYTPLLGNSVSTFTDYSLYETALGTVTTITFEGIATGGGQANAVNLVGNEFPGLTFTVGPGADGLFVGIPDVTMPGGNNVNFFAGDFFPTSGVAVFSPDAYPSPGSPNPDGALIVDFDEPRMGVGAFFLDVEGEVSSIEAFDGPGGTGNSLAIVLLQNKGDNSQSFAGIVAPDGIRSAILIMGGPTEGVGIDDLSFGPIPEPATILLLGLGGLALMIKRRA